MKLLLGATIAVLLGALVVSWQGMNQGVKNASPDELARIKQQIEELRKEQDSMVLQRQLQQIQSAPAVQPTVAGNAAEIDAMKAQLEANKQALAEMEAEKAKGERDKKLAEGEEGWLEQRKLESKDGELRRARMISDALLMGRVREYVEDPQLGGFVTFEVLMPEQVQVGTILAVRRNTGLLTQLKVSEVTAEGGIANPMPGFGPAQPKPGDELIIPPPF